MVVRGARNNREFMYGEGKQVWCDIGLARDCKIPASWNVDGDVNLWISGTVLSVLDYPYGKTEVRVEKVCAKGHIDEHGNCLYAKKKYGPQFIEMYYPDGVVTCF